MKQLYIRHCLLCLCLFIGTTIALADTVEIDGIYYNLITKARQAEVTSNPNRYKGTIDIPSTFIYNDVTYSVTSIGDAAFYSCSDLTSANIPNSVTSIGYGAFSNCGSLTSVNIPESVTNIGEAAYRMCSSLTSITIGNKVNSIGDHAFRDCSNLISVTIPESVTSISNYTFYGCSSLISVEIPSSVTTIDRYAFCGCSSLTSVMLPNSVTTIGEGAFSDCTGLSSVVIPNNVTSIGMDAFSGCSGLTSITIGNGVTIIYQGAFFGCTGLTSVTIPNNVKIIGSSAFKNCTNITTISIGNGVTEIGIEAFKDCQELTNVYCYAENIPKTNSDAFDGSYIGYATLYVPAVSVEQYKNTEPWKNFGTIVPMDGDTPKPEKCATPTICYINGELLFASKTEGAEFVSEITDTDIDKFYKERVALTVTYTISVYATKVGYDDSDIATATLCWIDVEPQTEGIEENAVTKVRAKPVLVQIVGSQVIVSGIDNGLEVAVYGVNGVKEGSAISMNGQVNIPTNLPLGTVALVRIGSKSVKIVVK